MSRPITYADKTSGISEATAADYNEIKDSINSRMTYEFNVMYPYGAVGDGVTDDTAAFQAAIDAWVSNGRRGDVVAPEPPVEYVIAGALQTTYNSQITIPPASFNDAAYGSLTIRGLTAPSRQGLGASPSSTGLVQTRKGVTIRSTLTTSGGDQPSVFGTIKHSSSRFNNTTIFLKNIRLLTTPDSNNELHMTGCNFGLATAVSLENVVVGPTIAPADLSGHKDGVVGIKMPYIGSNTNMSIRNCLVSGYKHGVVTGEHIVIENLDTFGCYFGITQLPNTYNNVIVRFQPQWSVYGINTDLTDLYIGDMPSNTETVARLVVISMSMEIEETTVFNQTQKFVNDPSNVLNGSAGIAGYTAADKADWPDSYFKNGAANFRMYRLHPDNGATDWTVTGSRGDGTALANLFTVLERRGVIVDDTTA